MITLHYLMTARNFSALNGLVGISPVIPSTFWMEVVSACLPHNRSTCLPLFSVIVHHVSHIFALLPEKRQIFCDLINFTDLKNSLAVAAARLLTNEINLAICKASRNSFPTPLSEHLRADLEWWKFLEWLQGCCSWPKEAHENVDVLCSDASNVLISLVWSHFCSMFSGYSWLLSRPGISTWYCFEGNPCPRYRHFNPFHQLCSTAGLRCSLTARS